MKHTPLFKRFPTAALSPLLALGSVAAGSLLYALTRALWQNAPLPLASAFSSPTPYLALLAAYGEELRLLLPMVLLPLLLRHSLPLYAFLFLRGFCFGFSAAYLTAIGPSVTLTLFYCLLSGGILLAYTGLAAFLEKRSQSPGTVLFPFLFYSGEIFLLILFSHLVYDLLLP